MKIRVKNLDTEEVQEYFCIGPFYFGSYSRLTLVLGNPKKTDVETHFLPSSRNQYDGRKKSLEKWNL
ncbi:hypothetical protein D1609_02555 [Leptospira borgpetersenii serovar Hardjo-bovis]|nr:hypothetical protein B9T54_02565 [Leptospira borgpetersenii serovar Hardjo-bovis]AYR07598.1 hypothetical protein D1609_02555 [Leptospira borgpetersenii serovar Hardjo-bovis]TQE52195.1 hypothetical protein FFZ95_11590 [Leptospira borgpetersenii]TQE56093.1 hypothetical protein FFZ96_11000 [Leptospira borgpetersenii]